MKNYAIIVAAGRGTRAGEGLPKQYRMLSGKAVLRHSVEIFLNHPEIKGVLVVINEDDLELYHNAVQGLTLLSACFGGNSRQISVKNGLLALAELNPDKVLIHDAARPFMSANLITQSLLALREHKAVIPAISVTDTIKTNIGGFVGETLNREILRAVQTPQGFDFKTLLNAHISHEKAENITDDASLIEITGEKIFYIEGEITNIKLTYEKDFAKMIKVAQGYDVHAFKEGDHVMLGGVRIPHNRGILAHSDGDVILHALTDAILGIIGDGDIGTHFPPSDDKWRGASSDQFLAHACKLLRDKGGVINHLDVSLVSESPKISPYREEIRERIAEIAGVRLQDVGLKATTSEKMGFTGRKEGLAALALVTVEI